MTVNKQVSILGESEAGVIVHPATNNPDCNQGGSGTFCTNASFVFLIDSTNVEIHDLTVDGTNVNNPAQVWARGGIVTSATPAKDTVIQNTTVKNIFLRGIYASDGGTGSSILIDGNTVSNVSGDISGNSIGIYTWLGQGTISNNTVSSSDTAITNNHSRGMTISGNTVSSSGVGIGTSNAGDSGGTIDQIFNNNITSCSSGGWGIYVFVPYNNVNVHDNTVGGCYVGVGVNGGSFSGPTAKPTITNNLIDGTGGTPADGAGVYYSNDSYGFGVRPSDIEFTGNTVVDFDTGIFITNGGGGFDMNGSFAKNRIVGNNVDTYLDTDDNNKADAGGTVGAGGGVQRVVHRAAGFRA